MLRIVILIYAAAFAAVAVQGIREDLRFGAPLWKAGLSTAANALGVAGMLLYSGGDVEPRVRSLWPWVLALIVVETLVQFRFTYRQRFRRVLPEGEPGDAQLRSLILTSVLLGLLAAAPYYWMNAMLAYGPAE